jgi:hypothetical protein
MFPTDPTRRSFRKATAAAAAPAPFGVPAVHAPGTNDTVNVRCKGRLCRPAF